MAKEEKLEEVKHLINVGKEKGYLTYDDLNTVLPPEVVSSEQIDNIMMMFGEMDIEVIDSSQEERYARIIEADEEEEEVKSAPGYTAVEFEEEEEEEEEPFDLTPGTVGKTDDPVRMYLREMGTVSLLSREGEIEIAKRIEDGQREIAKVMYSMPFALKELISLGDKLARGRLGIREVVHTYEEEFEEIEEVDEEELKDRTIRILGEAAKLYDQLIPSLTELKKPGLSESKEKRLRTVIKQAKKGLSEKLDEADFHPRQVEAIAQKLRDFAWTVMEAERDTRACARRAGVTVDELHAIFAKPKAEKGKAKVPKKVKLTPDQFVELEKSYMNARKKLERVTVETLVAPDELRKGVDSLDKG